jgi:hypothetical protein
MVENPGANLQLTLFLKAFAAPVVHSFIDREPQHPITRSSVEHRVPRRTYSLLGTVARAQETRCGVILVQSLIISPCCPQYHHEHVYTMETEWREVCTTCVPGVPTKPPWTVRTPKSTR